MQSASCDLVMPLFFWQQKKAAEKKTARFEKRGKRSLSVMVGKLSKGTNKQGELVLGFSGFGL